MVYTKKVTNLSHDKPTNGLFNELKAYLTITVLHTAERRDKMCVN